MSDPTENDLLEEIAASFPIDYDPAIHITARSLSDRVHVGEKAAYSHLRALVKQGKLREVENGVRVNGKRTAAFVKAE